MTVLHLKLFKSSCDGLKARSALKLLWTRELDEQDGFFFGKAYPSDYDHELKMFEYQFRDIQRLDWVNLSDVAVCTIEVK